MKLFRKTLVWFFIISLVFQPETSSAFLNLDQDYPSPTQSMDQIMVDLGVDKGELEKNIDETLNVTNYKKNPPGVTLKFVPESPIPGKKLTALATPANFSGDLKQMYYTWYLKRKGCEKAEKEDDDYADDYVETCDVNRDDEVNEEDWKIEAMGVLARGDWEPNYAGKIDPETGNPIIETTEDEDENGYEDDYDRYYEIVQEDRGSDPDKDGYDSVFGGEDQKGKPEHCYMRDIAAGVDYELAKKIEEPGVIYSEGEDEMDINIVSDENWIDGNLATKNWPVTSCFQVDSFNLTSEVIFYDHTKNNTWPVLDTADEGVNANIWTFWQQDGEWKATPWEWLRAGATYKSLENIMPGPGEDGEFDYIEIEPGSEIGIMVSGFSRHSWLFGSTVQERSQIVKLRFEDGQSTLPCPEYELKCTHLFPKKYHVDDDEIIIPQEDDEDLLVGDPGEEDFTTMEEKFWGTDPESKDTNNDGVPDEKALTGLGMNSLSWTYAEGDEIGVAVEGVSDNTDYKESSLKTMWGIPNNDFDGDDECELNLSNISPGFGGYAAENKIISGMDINDCLEENFVDPSKGTADTKIEVSLSFSPQYPINDPDGNNSDKLHIQTDMSNIENKAFAKYEWTLWECVDKAGSSCTPLDTAALDPKKTGLTKTTGIGIESLDVNLHLPSMDFLKVKLRVIESTTEAAGKIGAASIVIPLQETSEDIVPYIVEATEDLNLPTDVRLGQNVMRYADPAELSAACPARTCPAVKNEIIGMQFNGGDTSGKILSWSLDGNPLPTATSTPEKVYFPILKDVGSKYSVRLDITDVEGDDLGQEKITLTRSFNIEEPSLEIFPEDCGGASNQGCHLVEAGEFLNPLDRTQSLAIDYENDLFKGERNSTILISPRINFDRSALQEEDMWENPINVWFIDGQPADPAIIDANGNLRLSIDKEIGEKYDVSFKAFYTQPTLIKRALGNIWHVPDESFYEKSLSDSLKIEVIKDPNAAYRTGTQKIIASIFSAMPSYVNFLFRTIITLALILFMANLSFIVFPKRKS